MEAIKIPLEDLNEQDPDKLKQAMAIIGPEQYNLALAGAFLKEFMSDEKDTLATAEKITSLDKSLMEKLTTEEEAALNASKRTWTLAPSSCPWREAPWNGQSPTRSFAAPINSSAMH